LFVFFTIIYCIWFVFYILYALYFINQWNLISTNGKGKIVHLHFCKMHKCKCIITSPFVYITCLFGLLFVVFYSLYSQYFNINEWNDHLIVLFFIVFYIVRSILLCSHYFDYEWCNRMREMMFPFWTELFCPLQDSGCNCTCAFSDRDQAQVNFTTSAPQKIVRTFKKSSRVLVNVITWLSFSEIFLSASHCATFGEEASQTSEDIAKPAFPVDMEKWHDRSDIHTHRDGFGLSWTREAVS